MPPQRSPRKAPSTGAILLAMPAQTGAGIDPLLVPLLDRPLAAWALAALRAAPAIGKIILVVQPEQRAAAKALVASSGAPNVSVVVGGGADLTTAIRAGLDAFAPSVRQVVVQEATRPLVTPALLADGLAAYAGSPDLAVACASSPMKETVKRVRDGEVVETLDRSRLALLQTPMIFDRAALDQTSRAGGVDGGLSQLLRVMRSSGGRIATFPGGAENLAVATTDDLALAERLLRARRSS